MLPSMIETSLQTGLHYRCTNILPQQLSLHTRFPSTAVYQDNTLISLSEGSSFKIAYNATNFFLKQPQTALIQNVAHSLQLNLKMPSVQIAGT